MMEKDKDQNIRFITTDYDTLFRIPDGGIVEVIFPDRQFTAKCEYLDDYHTKIGDTVFHICEFAELLKKQGGFVRPEPETNKGRAVWQLSHNEYLEIKRIVSGFSYELFTKKLKSIVQGQFDEISMSMNEAREHILETLGMQYRHRKEIPYEVFQMNMIESRSSVLNELESLRRTGGKENTRISNGKEKVYGGKDCR